MPSSLPSPYITIIEFTRHHLYKASGILTCYSPLHCARLGSYSLTVPSHKCFADIKMGMSYRRYLAGERIYGCSTCKTHLATIHSMISRAFNGQHGRAYLFDGVVNVVEGEPNDRTMTTGAHTVRDIYCCKCSTCLGWKYVCPSCSSII
ncbi:hypothetical protein IW262DRAFT_1330078 [Armillaria fumosa]|nr:hypothetical protein IW262DRAFT_1330078 [Armillaria fumosa]